MKENEETLDIHKMMNSNKSIKKIQRMLDNQDICPPILYECLSNEYPIVVIPLIIKKDTRLLRVRINVDNFCFDNISQLSYPPIAKCGLSRASLPNQPMFYGAIPDKDDLSNNLYPRLVALSETSEELRSPYFSGCKLVTFSKWRIIENIHVFSFPVSQKYHNYTFNSINIRNYWNDLFIPNLNTEKVLFSEYIGDLMAYEGSNSIYEVTANAIHCVLNDNEVENKYQGIIYPSQRLDGSGCNIALTPQTADNLCQLEAVVTSVYTKKNDNTDIIDLMSAEWDSNGHMMWKKL